MAGQGGNPGGNGQHDRSCRPRPWPFPPPSVGWSVPVRGPVRLRPWTARTPEPGTHGRIADGGGPQIAPRRAYALVSGGDSGGASGL